MISSTKIFTLLTLIGGFLAGPAALAGECLNPIQVRQLRADFLWEMRDANQPELRFCNDAELTYKIMDGMLYLKRLQFSDETAEELSMSVLGKNPYDYFKTRIKTVVFDGEGAGCTTQKLADGSSAGINGYVDHATNKMHICDRASTLSKLEIAQFLTHEARHVDGLNYDHVHCEKSALRKFDIAMCDSSLDMKGAYGIGVEFNRKFYRDTKNNPALRQLARSEAMLDILQRFNTLPLDIKEGALLQDAKGVLSFFDGQGLEFVRRGDPHDLLVRQVDLPWIYNVKSGLAKTIFPAARVNNSSVEPADAYLKPLAKDRVIYTVGQQNFEQTIKRSELPELLDVYDGDYLCYLLTTRLLCSAGDGKFIEMRFHRITPVRLVATSAPGVLQAPVAILDVDMKLHPLPKDIKDLDKIADTSLTTVPWPNDVVRADSWNGGKAALVLTLTGELKTTPLDGYQPTPVPNLAGKRFKDMFAPYFYSTKLRDL